MNTDEFDHYPAALAEEERKLRWLIAQHPAHLELRYYLVFLLAANRRLPLALLECRQILALDHRNLLARVWVESLGRCGTSVRSVRPVSRWAIAPRDRDTPRLCTRHRFEDSHE